MNAALIQPAELKKLAALQPWKSTAAIAFDWTVIALAIAVSEYAGNVFVYLACAAVIAGRMHGLGVLMHEASHFRLFRNRKLNDWIGDVFTAWPILATVASYRLNHLAHHQNTNTHDDPDWVVKLDQIAFKFPQKAWTAIKHMGGYLIAVQTFRDLAHVLPRISRSDTSTRGYKLLRFGFYIGVVALMAWLGLLWQFFIYWLVPYFTVLFLFLHVRSVAEHFGDMDYEADLDGTRTVKPYFWERWFFAPHNVHYHLEHHLYPGVPFYNLPALHKALMKSERYRTNAHITRGYSTGLVRECIAEVFRSRRQEASLKAADMEPRNAVRSSVT